MMNCDRYWLRSHSMSHAGVRTTEGWSLRLNELANGSRWPASEISDGGSDRYCLSARALISTDRENAFDDGRRNAFSNAARPRFLWKLIDKAQFLANYGADDFRSCR